MFWPDTIKKAARERFAEKIAAGKPLVIRDEKTASGRVHVGSLRGVTIHGLISEVLSSDKVANTFLFEINDFDPMDGLPVYLDGKVFRQHMGKPLCTVPSPDGTSKNYAEYFGTEFEGVIRELGFTPMVYRASDLYRTGRFNNAIRLALEHADVIRDIYKRVSGAERPGDWLPLSVICPHCGKIGTTKARNFDGETVEFECSNFLEWASGCETKGRISPFDGAAKLPWKVEWAAKFTVLDVDIEGGGKDHSTRGGAREIADAVSREVYKREPPLNIPYEFFNVGGKKMSSSKGAGSSAREIADLLPAHILRFLLTYKEPMKVIDFEPDGDTIPILFDTYDKYAGRYFEAVPDDYYRVMQLLAPHAPLLRESHRLARFSEVAFLIQMSHMSTAEEFAKVFGSALTPIELEELLLREKYAATWLSRYAPEEYRYELQETLPAGVTLSPKQRETLAEILEFIKSQSMLDGQELHSKLHDIKSKFDISPKEFFESLYLIFLNKKSGPKAGWFLGVLDKSFVEQRLAEAVSA